MKIATKLLAGIVLAFSVALTGCGDGGSSTSPDSESASPVGTWSLTDIAGKTVVTVGADGSYSEVTSVSAAGVTGYTRKTGTWKVSGGSFNVILTGSDVSSDGSKWTSTGALNIPLKYIYLVSGNILAVSLNGTQETRYVQGTSGDVPAEVVAAPTITPATGTYSSTQSVTIEAANLGALVYFTLDGTTPDQYSTLYTDPIEVSATKTVKAIAVKNGTSSPVATAIITIQAGGGGSTKNSSLVGTWKSTADDITETVVFSQGGALSITASATTPEGLMYFRLTGKWSTSGSKLTTTITKAETSKDGKSWSAEPDGVSDPADATYSISGTTLTITDPEGGVQVYKKS